MLLVNKDDIERFNQVEVNVVALLQLQAPAHVVLNVWPAGHLLVITNPHVNANDRKWEKFFFFFLRAFTAFLCLQYLERFKLLPLWDTMTQGCSAWLHLGLKAHIQASTDYLLLILKTEHYFQTFRLGMGFVSILFWFCFWFPFTILITICTKQKY